MTAELSNPAIKPVAVVLRIAALIIVIGAVMLMTLGEVFPWVFAVAGGEPWDGPSGRALAGAALANLPVFFYLAAVAETGNVLGRVARGEADSRRNRIAAGLVVALVLIGAFVAPWIASGAA